MAENTLDPLRSPLPVAAKEIGGSGSTPLSDLMWRRANSRRPNCIRVSALVGGRCPYLANDSTHGERHTRARRRGRHRQRRTVRTHRTARASPVSVALARAFPTLGFKAERHRPQAENLSLHCAIAGLRHGHARARTHKLQNERKHGDERKWKTLTPQGPEKGRLPHHRQDNASRAGRRRAFNCRMITGATTFNSCGTHAAQVPSRRTSRSTTALAAAPARTDHPHRFRRPASIPRQRRRLPAAYPGHRPGTLPAE